MGLIINFVAFCFIINAVVFVRKRKISMRDYIKMTPNRYTRQDIIVGIFIGFLAMTCIYLVEFNLAYIRVQNISHINNKLISSFLLLALVAFGEELLFRGFMLNGLLKILKNQYVAVIITGVLFGLVHGSNPNATSLSMVSNGLGGVMYSIAFIESEGIWLPFALHFAWNFFQGPVFGFPVSGVHFGGVVQQSFAIGKNAFTGGGYGPEGGIIGISFRIVVIIMLLLYYYFSIKKRNDLM